MSVKLVQKYQGWTNYQTWVVALWFDNDQALYNAAREIVHETTEHLSDKCDTLRELAEQVVSYETLQGLAHDLMGNALDEVNWREIVEHMQED